MYGTVLCCSLLACLLARVDANLVIIGDIEQMGSTICTRTPRIISITGEAYLRGTQMESAAARRIHPPEPKPPRDERGPPEDIDPSTSGGRSRFVLSSG